MEEHITRVAKALGHPVRIHFVRALWGRDDLSPVEFSQQSEFALGTVAYHARILLENQVLEISDQVPRRGTMEHRYSLTGRMAAAVAATLQFLGRGAAYEPVGYEARPEEGVEVYESPGPSGSAHEVQGVAGTIVEVRGSIEWRLAEIAEEAERVEAALRGLDTSSVEVPRRRPAMQPPGPEPAMLRAPNDGAVDGPSLDAPASGSGRDRLLAAIEDHPGAPLLELAGVLKLRTRQVSELLARAQADHLVYRRGDGYAVAPWSS